MNAKFGWVEKGPGYRHYVACPRCAKKVILLSNDILSPELKDCYDHMVEEELRARARKLEDSSELARENKELRAGNRILRARLAKYEVRGVRPRRPEPRRRAKVLN